MKNHSLTDYQLWYGIDRPPPEIRELRAGPVTALLDGIDVRYVRVGSIEVVRRIYVAVRDQSWNTIAGRHRITRIEQQEYGFEVEFSVEHRQHDIDFAWQGRITGTRDGQIRYQMDGVANSAFLYNRIGICVLHPYKECAGRPFRAQTPQGEVSGELPELIDPQRFEQGFYLPLFPAFSRLSIELAGSIHADLEFTGDLFEMEDQRNWTDASYKTYSTPLSLGLPHQAHAGIPIRQGFTASIAGGSLDQQREVQGLRLSLGESTAQHLPAIGFSMNSDGAPLSERERERLRLLHPDHLRVDVHHNQDYSDALRQAIATCQALGCALELAIFLTRETADTLERLAPLLAENVHVARILVFEEGARTAHPSETTAPELIELARRHLQSTAPQAAFVGGTDMNFCELNRTRPQVAAMDGISFPIVPQVHAFDNLSLTETLEAQAETVKSARAFAAGRSIIVSPLTLKPRYNPHAAGGEAERAEKELPAAVDPRQMSLFGADWTVGSIKYLAESSAASLTYYEATGWRGLMERENGSPLPELFPSLPGMVFPLYHIFADIAEWNDGTIVACQSNQPLAVAALALQRQGRLHLLVTNFTAEQQHITIGPLAAERVALRSLDAQNAQEAMLDPEAYRQRMQQLEVLSGELAIHLPPYAIVRIDA